MEERDIVLGRVVLMVLDVGVIGAINALGGDDRCYIHSRRGKWEMMAVC